MPALDRPHLSRTDHHLRSEPSHRPPTLSRASAPPRLRAGLTHWLTCWLSCWFSHRLASRHRLRVGAGRRGARGRTRGWLARLRGRRRLGLLLRVGRGVVARARRGAGTVAHEPGPPPGEVVPDRARLQLVERAEGALTV